MENVYDIIIIGGGPGGSSAAIYAARAKRKVLVLDKPGRDGTLEASEHIANYPGVPGPVTGEALVKIMRDQARSFGAEYNDEVVISAFLAGEKKSIFTLEGNMYESNAVIIASGALERKAKIAGEEKYWGRGVSGCTTCDAPFFQGKRTVVIGNDDFAAEATLALTKFATSVHLITPSMKSRFSEDALNRLQANSAVTMQQGWVVTEILGDRERVTGARFQTKDGEKTLQADGIFLYLGGSKPSTGFLQGEIALDENGAIIVNDDQFTGVSLVYAVGDVTAKHVRQAVVATSEGCVAALALERDLLGKERIKPDYH